MSSNKRVCPTCGGVVSPVKRGGDPDEALAQHIRLAHNHKEKQP